jgi:uncharacterized membrane protein YozB (DUF420 family)
MDLHSQPGFLGTPARLDADITLLFFLLVLLPAMLTGFYFARRKKYNPHHKLTMTAITILTWLFIFFIMIPSYRRLDPSLPNDLKDAIVLWPTLHLIAGSLATLLATVLVLRMWLENVLPKALRFEPIKPWMRATLALWITTIVLGVVTYLTWYGLPFSKK